MARFRIVPERSAVFISARSSVHPIHSRSSGLEGALDLEVGDGGRIDLSVAPEGRLSLRVEKLSSGNPLEDREMRRRIDALRHPTIDGVLTGMKEAGADGTFVVRGDVTFRGVTQSYEDEVTVRHDDDGTLRIDGESTFDVRDFGMEPPRILMLRVMPDVKVRIEIVAERDE